MTETRDDSHNTNSGGELSSAQRIKIALIAVGGVAILGAVFFLIQNSVIRQETEIARTPTSTPIEVPPEEILWLYLARLPANLVADDGAVMGSIFIDLRLGVRGTADQNDLSQHLPEVRLAILRSLAFEGVGNDCVLRVLQ